jgi:hypothetical protein
MSTFPSLVNQRMTLLTAHFNSNSSSVHAHKKPRELTSTELIDCPVHGRELVTEASGPQLSLRCLMSLLGRAGLPLTKRSGSAFEERQSSELRMTTRLRLLMRCAGWHHCQLRIGLSTACQSLRSFSWCHAARSKGWRIAGSSSSCSIA